jgi:hypothetical protein
VSRVPAPPIINLRSRLAIEIALVLLTSFGFKTNIERSHTKSPTSPSFSNPRLLALLPLPAPNTSAPTSDLMNHDILLLPLKNSYPLLPSGSSKARVAQPGSLVFSAAELACFPPPHHHPPCFLNLLGPQVHGPSTNSWDFLYLVRAGLATSHCAGSTVPIPWTLQLPSVHPIARHSFQP